MVMTPERFLKDNQAIAKVRRELEAKLKDEKKMWNGAPSFDVVISGEYPKQLRDKLASEYERNGWKKVTHKTSSENKERPGLTVFNFVFPDGAP